MKVWLANKIPLSTNSSRKKEAATKATPDFKGHQNKWLESLDSNIATFGFKNKKTRWFRVR